MSAIRYGNLTAEIVSGQGVRISRLTLRQAGPDLLRSARPGPPPGPLFTGREQQTADALSAIQQGRPIGFHAACGYGKTALLQHIAAVAAERYDPPDCVYLHADRDRVGDLLQDLVTRLYHGDPPVKPTPAQCARLLGQVSAVIPVDDLSAGPEQVDYLLGVLSGCSVVIGSDRPIAGLASGADQRLTGLSADDALALLSRELGRPLAGQELPAARDLADAVDGQPLHLRQAAALLREGPHSLESLARHAAGDVGALDRLSINALADRERRALAVLALAAGALLPAEVVDVVGQIAELGDCLTSLHRRGLAEHDRDRFGLPVCKATSYREMLLEDLHLGSSARELCHWLSTRNPTASESLSAAEAALAILEFAAEREEWATVLRLARAAEPVLFLAGRWEAWHHVLGQGLAAAKATQDTAAAAFFTHQLGSRALCLDQLDDALRLLQTALTLREQAEDRDGADLTRHNLRLLEPPEAPPEEPRPPRRRRAGHPVALALASLLGVLALIVGGVAAASTLWDGGSGPKSGPSYSVSPPPTRPVSPPPTRPVSPPPSTIVSTPSRVVVADVIGQSQSQATSTLQGQGLAATASSTSDCHAPDNGDVVSQNPLAGTSVFAGAPVTISVCAVTTPTVLVPNVIGLTEAQAGSTLQAAGLTAAVTRNLACTSAEEFLVVSQDPQAEASVSAGSPVTIGICGVTTPMVNVADVIDQSQAQATSTLEAQGLTVSAISVSNCGAGEDGDVVSENPVAGTSVSVPSSVTIGICIATA